MPEKDQRPVSARLASAFPRHALLQQATAQVCVDQTFFGSNNRVI
jgi:hypothetical protein